MLAARIAAGSWLYADPWAGRRMRLQHQLRRVYASAPLPRAHQGFLLYVWYACRHAAVWHVCNMLLATLPGAWGPAVANINATINQLRALDWGESRASVFLSPTISDNALARTGLDNPLVNYSIVTVYHPEEGALCTKPVDAAPCLRC